MWLAGHKKENCWESEENSSKRPEGYKTKSKRGLVSNNQDSNSGSNSNR